MDKDKEKDKVDKDKVEFLVPEFLEVHSRVRHAKCTWSSFVYHRHGGMNHCCDISGMDGKGCMDGSLGKVEVNGD